MKSNATEKKIDARFLPLTNKDIEWINNDIEWMKSEVDYYQKVINSFVMPTGIFLLGFLYSTHTSILNFAKDYQGSRIVGISAAVASILLLIAMAYFLWQLQKSHEKIGDLKSCLTELYIIKGQIILHNKVEHKDIIKIREMLKKSKIRSPNF